MEKHELHIITHPEMMMMVLTIDVNLSDTISYVKEKFEEKTKCSLTGYNAIFAGKSFTDDMEIEQCGVCSPYSRSPTLHFARLRDS